MKLADFLYWFRSLSRNIRFFLNILMVLFIAYLDYKSPVEFSVRLLYLIPLFLSAWYEKKIITGIVLSVICTFMYYFNYVHHGLSYLHGFYFIWELFMVYGFFIIFVLSIDKIKNTNRELKESHNSAVKLPEEAVEAKAIIGKTVKLMSEEIIDGYVVRAGRLL